MSDGVTKAIIYCRVSSERQVKEGHGLDSQERRCRDYCKEHCYQVVKCFSDDGVSGKLFDRPAMKAIIAYIDSYPTEGFVIVFDDLSRFARDVKVHLQLKAELVSRGARLECPNFSFQDTEEGEFIENVTAAAQQYDRQKNRRQVIQKMKARLDDGYWPFYPPPGLINKEDPVRGKILVPQEPYATIYKGAIELFRDMFLVTIEDVRQYILKQYRAFGINKDLSLNGARFILAQRLYAGLIDYKPWGVSMAKAKHDGFVSPETYYAVMARFSGKPKPRLRENYNDDFPLNGAVTCAKCGGPLTGAWNRGRSNRYPNYSCHRHDCPFQWKVTRRDIVEEGLMSLLKEVKPSEELIDLAIEILNDQWAQRKASHDLEHKQGENELRDIEDSLERFNGRISKAKDEEVILNYEAEIKRLLAHKKEIAEQSLKHHYSSDEFGTASKLVLETLKDPVNMWKNGKYEEKRTVIYMYFGQKLAYDYASGFGTADLACPIKVIKDLNGPKDKLVEMGRMTSRVKLRLLIIYKLS